MPAEAVSVSAGPYVYHHTVIITGRSSIMASRIVVLYPHPSDADQFNTDYEAHTALLKEKLPHVAENCSVTRFAQLPGMPSPYHLMFTAYFDTKEDMQATLMSSEMREVGKDAARISSGGAPVILVGGDQ